MNNRIQVVVFTTEYQASHGHQPKGRGLWAFFILGNGKEPFWVNDSTYGEAKKLAIQRARNMAIADNRRIASIQVGA